MRRNDEIKVNSKQLNLAVKLSQTITIDWKALEIPQSSYMLVVLENNSVIKEIVMETDKPYASIKLNKTDARKQYKVIVTLKNKEEEKTFYTYFFSENQRLTKAKWITRQDNPIEKELHYYKDKPNILLEKSFNWNKKSNCFIDIVGLGYYSLRVNGQKIESSYLTSDITSYGKIVYYDTYRLDDYLLEGNNCLTVELANGWYNPAPLKLLTKYNFRQQLTVGKPMMICQLSYLEGNNQVEIVESDRTWESKCGHYLFDNVFIGERIDIRQRKLDSFSRTVNCRTVAVAGPGGILEPSRIPKIKRTQLYQYKKITQKNDGILLDFERMITGHFSCLFKKHVVDKVTIYYSEELNEVGELDFRSSANGVYGIDDSEVGITEQTNAVQKDEIILNKQDFKFENQFTYHSFRYVYLKGAGLTAAHLKDICAYDVHTDLDINANFESSSHQLNLLYQSANDTKLNNIHSYYEDCPRERLGYGGDIVALIESQIKAFDSEQLLLKVLTDFLVEQTSSGGITQTAPYIGIQTHGPSDKAGSLGWQLVLPTLIQYIKNSYYQPHIIEENSDALLKHVNYLLSFDYDYVKYCCLGDWGSIDTEIIEGKETPPDKEFCSAVMYYLLLKGYSDLLAGDLYQKIHKKIELKLKDVKEKIVIDYYNDEGYFQTGSQSSYIFALKSGIAENNKEIYANFLAKIKQDKGVFRAGIFGMSWMYSILKQTDSQLIYSWLVREPAPSLLSMLDNSGIISEYFEPSLGSLNHAMFTSYSSWIIEKILGITINNNGLGERELSFSPFFNGELTFAKGGVTIPEGRIKVDWKKEKETYTIHLVAPASINVTFDIDQSFEIVSTLEDGFSKKIQIVVMN
ncbi:family 78 glycoside hydrolase catalytic domain [Vagococcus sp. BWB3-3]|uniref:alpha-L-rhamnosidase n=1 Tax=Vagococcus allomyrinae TaxID=2794353 RepID=A0A940STF4_9ENTE|nr:family 78 glycoside hydrolase catalytic domain [Vagococcus allomyrinae]MBP1040245.1 family 78 glycoside hydrolase catalytic domain [Vagococcus allomyrinae]